MFGGNAALTEALAYAAAHGGGTIAVASQNGAPAPRSQTGADIAALGGFSGRESEVSASWLAERWPTGRSAGSSPTARAAACRTTGAPAARA